MPARLAIHVQPRARRTEVAGMYGDAVRVRVAAPPVEGAANEELCRFLADRLGLARRAVRLAAGASGRRKVVELDGLAAEEARARLVGPDPEVAGAD